MQLREGACSEQKGSPVILLATTCWWHSGSRLALSLAEAGCSVSAIYPTRGSPVDAVPAIHKRFPYDHQDPLQALRDAISAVQPDIVIPCDDRVILHLQQLHAQESRGGCNDISAKRIVSIIERSLGDPDAFAVSRSRYRLISLAKAAGLPAPETAELCTSQDLDQWLSQHGFPTVLKVDGSSGGIGVFVVQSRSEAHQVFRKLSQNCPFWLALKRRVVNRDPYWLPESRRRTLAGVSAQTYIEGFPANCAVFSWKGRILAGIAVEVLQTENPKAPATVVKVVDRQEILHAAHVLAARLGLSGFFGLDFMVDSATNVAQLIEMNARPTPLCHLRLGPGRDMVGALTATLSGRPLSESCVTSADVIAYFPSALQVKGVRIPAGAYHDIPTGAPELVTQLLQRPWPNRGLLARELDRWVGIVNLGKRLLARRTSQKPSIGAALEQSSVAPATVHAKGN